MARRVLNTQSQPVIWRMNPLALPRSAHVKIGLLGGSFNPAHEGHRQISLDVWRALGLRAVWWLVSPQNPLKSKAGTPPVPVRLAACEQLLRQTPQLVPTDIETRMRTQYTLHTLRKLKARWPAVQFVWVMGADNLAQFHRWKCWRQMAKMVPMVVVDRAPFSHHCLRNRAALTLASTRRPARALTQKKQGVWTILFGRRYAQSSTALRKKLIGKP